MVYLIMDAIMEVTLLIDGNYFKVNKDVLCEHSDYFRAMFSGKFNEIGKEQISIDVVDSNSMNIIVKYMEAGLLDLSEYNLSVIGDLAIAANFLQITELIKQIEFCLELQLSPSNWIEIMTIAENALYIKLEERCLAYGLYQFKLMKPEYIQPVHKLVWYLSHTHLNSQSELDVFEFGLDWIVHNETGADALLFILGCLDMSKLTKEELRKIKALIKDYVNSLAEKVIDCLYKLVTEFDITVAEITKNKILLCETYTERVYKEVINLVNDSPKRELRFKPCVALWSKEKHGGEMPDIMPHYLHIFDEGKFLRWLQAAEKALWGWNVIAWGPTKIVIVCGEHGRGTGYFWKGVKVYDTLKKEWSEHGVQLPSRRHSGVAIVEDSLYIVGGVGGYRVVLDSAIVYDLRQQTFRKIAKFPNAIQSPGVCTHNNEVYAAGHKYIYCYKDYGVTDRWVKILETSFRPTCIVSYKGYIYCMQNYFNNLYRFRPTIDVKLEAITCFSNSLSTLCCIDNRLLAFTNTNVTQSDMVTVEEYREDSNGNTPTVIWSKKNCSFAINDVAGPCAIIDTIPPIKKEISPYLKRYIAYYEASYSI